MQHVNCSVVFNKDKDKVLFCKRSKEPYKGLYNFVGGKLEPGEQPFDGAYRELQEETGIGRADIRLYRLMDFTYYEQRIVLEIYVGQLQGDVMLKEEVNPLEWLPLSENFADPERFAGDQNIAHIINMALKYPLEGNIHFGRTSMVREITEKDYMGLMQLYMQLHDNPMPEKTKELMALWKRILNDHDHHIIVAEVDGKIVSSCVCVIIPNLTHHQQPYAFVENVITDKEYRCQGLATACLDYAKEIAQKENCYKLMLLTGSKRESTLEFYRRAGYNSEDKTAFIQWI